jgi:hypothetical protein
MEAVSTPIKRRKEPGPMYGTGCVGTCGGTRKAEGGRTSRSFFFLFSAFSLQRFAFISALQAERKMGRGDRIPRAAPARPAGPGLRTVRPSA